MMIMMMMMMMKMMMLLLLLWWWWWWWWWSVSDCISSPSNVEAHIITTYPDTEKHFRTFVRVGNLRQFNGPLFKTLKDKASWAGEERWRTSGYESHRGRGIDVQMCSSAVVEVYLILWIMCVIKVMGIGSREDIWSFFVLVSSWPGTYQRSLNSIQFYTH